MAFREPATAKDKQVILAGILRVGDAVVVVAAALLTYWVRAAGGDLPPNYLVAITLAVLLTANYMHVAGVYRLKSLENVTIQIGRVAVAWGAVLLTLLALAFFTKTSATFSRIWLIAFGLLAFSGFLTLRLLVLLQIARWRQAGHLHTKIAIVGGGDLGQRLIRHLRNQPNFHCEVVGVYDDRHTRVPVEIEGVPLRGTVDDLVEDCRKLDIDEIIIALPWRASGQLVEITKKLKSTPVNVKLSPEVAGFQIPVRGFGTIAGLPMLNVFERPLSGWSLAAKAIEDRVLAAIILVVIAPVLVLIAIAIKLDSPGPVFFRQRRYGFNNNEITVLKFRTMYHSPIDDPTVPQARPNDPRVTRVGAVLRRTSLDELPQLFNVLAGDMSLVGPRPHAVAHNKKYAEIIDDYLSRHRVKPGITGWAQVNGLRGETDTPEKMQMRVQHDLYYIEHWSLLFDFRILFLTLFVGFAHENAY